jgi:hypothetical protein
MAESIDNTDRGFVEYWRRAGKALDHIETLELRDYRHEDHLSAIDALLQIAVDHAEPRATSGLVELHRWLAKSRR